MTRLLTIGLAMGAFVGWADPVATVVSVENDPLTKKVKVTYSLTEPTVITLGVETSDDGRTWTMRDDKVLHAVGDVNREVSAGSMRMIVWDADRDWPGHPKSGEQVRMSVRCWPADNLPTYFVMSLKDSTQRMYFMDERQIPGGISHPLYKTDFLVMRRIYAKDIVWPMGSPSTESGRDSTKEAQHYVKIGHDYYLAVYEMTQAQHRHLTGKTNSARNGEMLPVDAMDYKTLRGAVGGRVAPAADSYLGVLRTSTGLPFDLPTEAEWEFACRAGTGGSNYAETTISDIAWMSWNKEDNGVQYQNGMTREVGTKGANAWGLYDMLGNVTEWCRDYFNDGGGSTDIQNPDADLGGPEGGYKNRYVKRGGAYCSPPAKCRSAARGYLEYDYARETASGNGAGTYYSSGYRLALPL